MNRWTTALAATLFLMSSLLGTVRSSDDILTDLLNAKSSYTEEKNILKQLIEKTSKSIQRLQDSLKKLPELDPEARTDLLRDFLGVYRDHQLLRQADLDLTSSDIYDTPDMNMSPEFVRDAVERFRFYPAMTILKNRLQDKDGFSRCRSRLLLAKTYSLRGEISNAVSLHQSFIADTDCPCRDYGLYFLAGVYMESDHIKDAQKTYRQLIREYPDFPFLSDVYISLADTYVSQDNDQAVFDLFKDNERSGEAFLIRLARSAAKLGKTNTAERTFRKLWLKYPAGRYATEVEQSYKDILKKNGKSFPSVSDKQMFDRAKRLDKAGLRDAAAEIYGELMLKPVDEDIKISCRLYRAKILHDTRKNEEAIAEYEAFLKQVPGHSSVPTALLRMATIYRRLGDDRRYLEVVDTIDREHSWSVRWAEALIGRGEYWRGLGRLEAAAEDFKKIIRKGGESADTARWKMAWIYWDQNDYENAEKSFARLASRRQGSDWEPQALYWSARCLEKKDDAAKAQEIYRDLVTRFSWNYSGQLAAKRLKVMGFDVDTSWSPRPSPLEKDGFDFHPSSKRARLLMDCGYYEYAAYEWERYGRNHPSKAAAIQRAVCLSRAQQEARARLTVFQTYASLLDNGEVPKEAAHCYLPFPDEASEYIRKYSKEYDVDPMLVASVILQESGFNPAALSYNLAAGYMQLMPVLFLKMSGDWEFPLDAADRFVPEYNIRAGIKYLKTLLAKYDNQEQKALAAYNAGEHRVDLWQQQFPTKDMDEWTEHIPFQQTRLFVKKIMENYSLYSKVYSNSY